MIKVSIGSAIELGLKKACADIPPTTAYIMIGEKCENKCLFCSQSVESSSRKDKLSRILWPSFEMGEFIDALKEYSGENIKRVCLQIMGSCEAINEAKAFVKDLKKQLDIPISVSAKIENKEDLKEFLHLGADKIGMAIDCVDKDAYEIIKGKDFDKRIDFIKSMGCEYKNRISTHMIVGLGETHEQIFDLYYELNKCDITISLFAFTPVRGTKLENKKQPPIEDYRKVQLMTYLIKKGYEKECFNFENGNLQSIKDIKDDELNEMKLGIPFEISGCKDCNRPYYNERPGGCIYNYSRKLSDKESKNAIEDLNMNFMI